MQNGYVANNPGLIIIFLFLFQDDESAAPGRRHHRIFALNVLPDHFIEVEVRYSVFFCEIELRGAFAAFIYGDIAFLQANLCRPRRIRRKVRLCRKALIQGDRSSIILAHWGQAQDKLHRAQYA